MGNDRYDLIIVGAGPAGSTAARTAAQKNLSVALIERGKYPGSKNMFGGTIFSQATAKIIPNFQNEAPLERAVTSEKIWLMEVDSVVEAGFTGYNYAKPPYNTFTAIRSRFDRWLANKAVEAGAKLMTSTLVKDIIFEKIGINKKKAVGIILEDNTKIYSDTIILAEGAMAYLTQKAGLRKKIDAKMLTLYVKELLSLPENIIEARFNLEKNEGANIAMVGYPTGGIIGKGGLWVNKDTISLVVGGYLDEINKKGQNPYQLLERLKKHPTIKRLLSGAKTVQYMSKIIPKGGYYQIPQLYDNGILIAGNAAMFVAGRHGTDVAMLSGKYAAETAIQAKAKNDFSKEILSIYENKINNSFFFKDMKTIRKIGKYYHQHPDSDFLISQITNEIAAEFFTENLNTQSQKLKNIMIEVESLQPVLKTLNDIYYALFNWRVF